MIKLKPQPVARDEYMQFDKLRNRKFLLPVAGLVALAYVLVSFLSQPAKHNAARGEQTTLTVRVTNPKSTDFSSDIVMTGTVLPRDLLQVGSELNGLEVRKILAEEGQKVRKGDILAQLDTAVLQANLMEEEAHFKIAQASLKKALQPNRKESIAVQDAAYQSAIADIAQKQTAIAKAQAEYDNAVSIAQRYQQLYTEGGATAQDAQQKATDVQSFMASLSTAKESLRQAQLAAIQQKEKLNELKSGGRIADVSIAHGTVEQHQARIANLKAQLEQTLIRAPADGVVSERLAHIGDISTAGQVMFRLIRNGELEFQAKVSAEDLPKITLGQKVEIEQAEHKVEGYVWLVSTNVDPVTRLGKVRVALANSDCFKNGMFVTGKAKVNHDNSVLVVPETALLTVDGSNYVFIEKNGIVSRQEVRIGNRTNHLVQVHSGLVGTEKVVEQGVAFLSDGDRVSVK